MICPTCDGLGQELYPRQTCRDCHGWGKIDGLCWECGYPLRDCDTGATCVECVEEAQAVEHLDTRPEDRAAQAWEHYANLVTIRNFSPRRAAELHPRIERAAITEATQDRK